MAKTPKWQLVASVSVTVTGTPRRRKNEPPPRYNTTRTAVYRIRLGPESVLTCDCRANAETRYDPEALVPDVDPAGLCSHVAALYKAKSSYAITLTPLGREMFVWRYAAEALK